MSFPAYPKYKHSGEQWLGSIPDTWETRRVKSLFEINKRIAGQEGYDVLSITQKGLKVKDLDNNEGQLAADYSGYQIVEPGDFAMNHMDLLTGWIDVASVSGVTSPDYRVFSPRDASRMNSRYFLHVFQTAYREKILYASGQGASQLGRWRLPKEQFNDFVLPFPPLVEQDAIVSALDSAVEGIDVLIAEQRRLIELLNEKRRAVISQAVTKGINSDGSMQPSGIDWLGDIPAHWDVQPGRWALRCRSGLSLSNGHLEESQRNQAIIPVIGGNGVMGYSTESNVEPPTIVVGRVGALCGNVHVIYQKAWVTDNALIVDGDLELFCTPYLAECLRCRNLNELASKTAQPLITGTQIKDQRLPRPPLPEQESIASFVSGYRSGTEELASVCERSIDLLEERRSALISLAVTGKIDVRNAVPEYIA